MYIDHTIVINPLSAAMGRRFRAVGIDFCVTGATGTMLFYYLLAPPGSQLYTAEQISGYADESALASGAYARGQFTLDILDGAPVSRTLIGRETPDPFADEVGVIDGLRYDVQLIAVTSGGAAAESVRFAQSAIGMPFDYGQGTSQSPFGLRELSRGELAHYPDLNKEHPRNAACVDETARMLDNIEGMRVLYERTNGLDGMEHSLDAHYMLETGFDLQPYAQAYHGRGWRPIGNFGATCLEEDPHTFSGAFFGRGADTAISGLSITAEADAQGGMEVLGLFGTLFEAHVSNIQINGAALSAAPSHTDNTAAVGTLAGLVGASNIYHVTIKNSDLSIRAAANSAPYTNIGGLVGVVMADCDISDIVENHVIIYDTAGHSCAGGLIGQTCARGETNVSICNVTMRDISMDVHSCAGGLIGCCEASYMRIRRADMQRIRMNAGGSDIGGLMGCFFNYNLGFSTAIVQETDIRGIEIHSSAEDAARIGGFIGSARATGLLSLENCSVFDGKIDGLQAYNAGGFIGIGETQGEGRLEATACMACANVHASTYVGGFVGYTAGATRFVRCRTRGDIHGAYLAGGFAGACLAAMFSRCAAGNGLIQANSAGGFAAVMVGGLLEDCRVDVNLKSGAGTASGLIGLMLHGAQIARCYYTGQIVTGGIGAGLVGFAALGGGAQNSVQSSFVLTGKIMSASKSAPRRILQLEAPAATLQDNYALNRFLVYAGDARILPTAVGVHALDGATVSLGRLEETMRAIGWEDAVWNFQAIGRLGGPTLRMLPDQYACTL